MTTSTSKSAFLGSKISFPFSSQIKILFAHLLKNGDEVRIVGGAVRDFLAGKKIIDIVDIDLACKYSPEKTSALLEKHRIKVIASGIKYGTVTAIVDHKPFQITTLRKDIKNFGRDCEVEFVDNYFEDAKRRDFTINALYVDSTGQLYDYFGGEEDLKNHIVRFIGNAEERITEDYLRILRFFRFSCYHAKTIDPSGFAACIKYKNHLSDLSLERIRAEFFKMLECKNRDNLFSIFQIMHNSGILEFIITTIDNQRLEALKNLFALEKILDHPFEPLMLLALICDTQNLKLSLSNTEKKYLQSVAKSKLVVDFKISKKNLLKLLLEFNPKELIDIFTIQLVLNNNFENLIDDFLRISKMVCLSQISGQIPDFPISGYDLIDLKIKPQNIGKTLKIAQNYWWENDFSVDKQQILSFIKTVPISNNDIFVQINNSIADELSQINQTIIASAKGKADLIAEITNHLVLSGGKRVRPILTVLAAKLCGYNSGTRHCNLAAAVELIHTATLLHDDVVDGSSLRRGKKTANSIWDNKASILVGDYLLSVAFQLMVKDGSLEVLDILSKTSGIMADGEVMQLMNSNDIAISEEKYLEIISYKTAILFSAATSVGAIITNSDAAQQKSLADFGNNLGIAFQIMDDVLDYNADEKTLGKKIGNDFFEGKITLPIILTYKQASEAEKSRIKELFAHNLITNQQENDEQSFVEIMDLMKKYNGLEESINKALFYQNLAAKNLEKFADSQEKSMLLAILEYGISRKN